MRRSSVRSETIWSGVFGIIAIVSAGSYLSLFAVGAALRLLQPSGLLDMLGRNRLIMIALLLLGLFLGAMPSKTYGWGVYRELLVIARNVPWPSWLWTHSLVSFWHGIGAALIVLVVCGSPFIQASLSRPTGRFLGHISFPLYVLHLPVLTAVLCNAFLILHRIGVPALFSSILSLALFLVAAVGTAALLTPLIEGGAIRLSARLGTAMDGQATWVGTQCRRRLGILSSLTERSGSSG